MFDSSKHCLQFDTLTARLFHKDIHELLSTKGNNIYHHSQFYNIAEDLIGILIKFEPYNSVVLSKKNFIELVLSNLQPLSFVSRF